MSKHHYFCEQLASWYGTASWHFTTLMAVTIEAVEHLPDGAEHLVHDLLQRYDEKPRQSVLLGFLSGHHLVRQWFAELRPAPKVFRVNINLPAQKPLSSVLPALYTAKDVAQWLGLSINQLIWLADLRRVDTYTPNSLQHYHYQLMPKRSGHYRLIESPKSLLKAIQQKIYQQILQYAPVHSAAHGFRQGKSCKTHAQAHCAKAYVLLFDLSDYFHSVTWLAVYQVFHGLGFPAEVARLLTGLCSHQCQRSLPLLETFSPETRQRLWERHLPQGAPSSPALANSALYHTDHRLNSLANSLGLHYSRYADDLAFSGDQQRDWSFFEPLVGAICIEQGFQLNHKKTRVLRPHQKQLVTGVVVNQKVNIDRRYYDRLKAILTNCRRHGLASQNRQQHTNFREHLQGKIQHVSWLNPAKGRKLQAIFDHIE